MTALRAISNRQILEPIRYAAFWLLAGALILTISLLPLEYAALLVGSGILVTLALIDPVWALYAAVLSVPLQEIVTLPGGLTFTQAALLLAAGVFGIHTLARPEHSLRWGRVGLGLAILLWALALAGALTPYSQTEALKETLRWSTVFLIYMLVLNGIAPAGRTESGWQWRAEGLVICLIAAPSAEALYGLWQFITADGPPSFGIAGGRFVRAYGTIGQPNSFAGYMNMAWPLAGAPMLIWLGQRFGWLSNSPLSYTRSTRPSLGVALLAATATGALLAALIASFSRGGWVGALAGALAMLLAISLLVTPAVRQRAGQMIALVGAGGILLLAIGGSGLLPNALAQRVNSITANLRLFDVRTVQVTPTNFAVVERMAHLQAAWSMVQQRPITGVGPGNFSLAYETTGISGMQPYAEHPWYESRGHAHNYYLHIAAEAGLIGGAAYLLMLGLLILQTTQALRHADSWLWRSVTIGGCGVIAAIAAHNLFENLHVLNMGIQLGAIWGLLGIPGRESSV